MLRIVPVSFARHTCEEIYSCLLQSRENSFEVLLPRIPYDAEYKYILMLDEYQDAIYCGELLSKFGTEFCYRVPLENSRLPFCFRFKTDDIEQLANTIYYLASAAVELVDWDRYYYYLTERNNFCFDEENCPVCCGLEPISWDLMAKF